VRREPNRRLAAVMAEAGASNKGLARRVRDISARQGVHLGTTHVSVQRWLDGGGIQPQTAAFLAEALTEKVGRKITPSDLGLPEMAPAASAGGIGYAHSLPEALDHLDTLTRLRPDDGQTSAELLPENDVNSAVLSWLVSRSDGLTVDAPGARRVGMRDVVAVRTAAEMFMHLDFKFGGGHGHKALRHYFREDVLPLLGASYSERVGKALFEAATEIAQLLAWTAYDTGNHTLAKRYLIATLRLTQVIDDRMMGARILTNMSHQANPGTGLPRRTARPRVT